MGFICDLWKPFLDIWNGYSCNLLVIYGNYLGFMEKDLDLSANFRNYLELSDIFRLMGFIRDL